MLGTLTINCPPMPVNNTGWTPWSDRLAEELPCEGKIRIGERIIKLLTKTDDPERYFRFPEALIRRVRRGLWMVEPVVAFGWTEQGKLIEIHYPEEPIKREGVNMVAQPVDNLVSHSFVGIDGKRYPVAAGLPLAVGRPVGFGLFQFIVEAVTIEGMVG